MFTDKRKTRHNSTFAIGGVSCSADSFVVAKSFVLRINISGKNPAHRKSANRYGLTYNIEKWKFDDYKLLKSVMVNGDRRTIKKLK